MDYWKYTLRTGADTAEILLAYLGEAPFDTFEETPEGLDAYLPASADALQTEQALDELRAQFEFDWEKTFLPGQNWNEVWESNFQPVVVGNFCAVRADFHPPLENVRYELVINPKMAFGTGHHETTWLCLAALERLPVQGAHLLDFGCGTGILAIMAARLGAAQVEAIDIEEEAYRNTLENSAVNGVAAQITARQGVLSDVQGSHFDGVLANINRNVLLDAFPHLADLLKPGGWLLISGILAQDEAAVSAAAEAAGFIKKGLAQRGNWVCVEFARR